MDRGPTRRIDRPEPGSWKVRLHSGGPLVFAEIRVVHTTHEPGNPENVMERSPFLAAFINNRPVKLNDVWHRRPLEDVPETDLAYERADGEWAVDGANSYARNVPKARPREKIDPLQVELPF